MQTGTLYIVGTPIGNLEDISFRAVRILKEVDLIAAEDTRHTKKLLNHYDIHKPLESYHKFNEKQKTAKLISILEQGKNIALVTNAGMPGISDPGEIIIQAAISHKIPVVPIPGPTALILSLIVSGLATEKFAFEGFLPRKKGMRQKHLQKLKSDSRTHIFYEAGNRLANTVSDIYQICGDRQIAIARELTKKFEEIIRGKCSIICDRLAKEQLKGECVLVVAGNSEVNKKEYSETEIRDALTKIQQQGQSRKEAIKQVAKELGLPKRQVYRIAINMQK